MPEITPNQHMLTKYKHYGPEPWRIYSSCVRELISKYSGLPMRPNNLLKEKLDYYQFMNKGIDQFTYANTVVTKNSTPSGSPSKS